MSSYRFLDSVLIKFENRKIYKWILRMDGMENENWMTKFKTRFRKTSEDMDVRGRTQKFPDWPPAGARTADGTALCH
jgi:hypothetical protein